jgi:antitoxin FitA
MTDLLIPNVDAPLYARLKALAAQHGRSPEEEVREILRTAVERQEIPARRNVADIARELFGPEHGFDLDIPPRGSAPGRPPPDFSNFD